ncbi:uncharacterized protein EI90DRAFT_3044585 [Cantharellus anzutake]|uniref:uncharacterized protein n=1 Tax=Cantharellus anzutake TaxID=1750568 RepID=UPI00190339A5|nr:uncharacterized protein EI90DRAFT_3044585 [Cantharellus anzutake]KAF8337021.1 hypothetical protein EI90DRAFT_3044585 [Cantharellus anzutake]
MYPQQSLLIGTHVGGFVIDTHAASPVTFAVTILYRTSYRKGDTYACGVRVTQRRTPPSPESTGHHQAMNGALMAHFSNAGGIGIIVGGTLLSRMIMVFTGHRSIPPDVNTTSLPQVL